MFDNMGALLTGENIVALLTLTLLEIVLGIDNVIFIALLTGKLSPEVQAKARKVGLLGAMGMRILLLLGISWITKLTKPLFTLPVLNHEMTGKDLVLLIGGLFLIVKSTYEIHERIEEAGHSAEQKIRSAATSFAGVIVQIMIVDIVFSLDSVITAIGMARDVKIMIAAVIVSVAIMMVFAGAVSRFVEAHPTMKVLALSFLLLIGIMLVADGLGHHIEKGYIYFAMCFALAVEIVNVQITKRRRRAGQPVAH
ncbi:TerC family protein [soil metagenome]